MSYIATIDYRVASSLRGLDDRWQIVARRPLAIGAWDQWIFVIPDDSVWRGARMLGAVITAQARDGRGEPILLAKRGRNQEWWKSREMC